MVEPREKGEEIYRRLRDDGLFPEIGSYEAAPDDGKITYGEGNPITAVEKFLGYFDSQMNIANFPSISFNTDFSVAKTACMFTREPGEDSVMLDGEKDEKYENRAGKAVNFFKNLFGIKGSFRFYIEREKRYEDAKGLGESAAIASSTSRAVITNIFGEEAALDAPFVSRIARLVSGSGTRSSMDGFSMWLSYPWVTEDLCHGVKLPVDSDKMNIMAFPATHAIRTDSAHKIALASPYYPRWMINKFSRIEEIMDSGYDLELLMRHAEEDMFLMHSVLMANGTIIHTPGSLEIINRLKTFKESNPGIYFTSDTGPSLVVMSKEKKLLEEFSELIGRDPLWGKVKADHGTRQDRQFMKKAEEYLTH